jgi:isocitrate dehydrogenase
VKEIDNRGSHFYLALYWAQALAECGNAELKSEFGPIAAALTDKESAINKELIDCQGSKVDIGGYYKPDDAKAFKAMRPSATFNNIIDALATGIKAEVSGPRLMKRLCWPPTRSIRWLLLSPSPLGFRSP